MIAFECLSVNLYEFIKNNNFQEIKRELSGNLPKIQLLIPGPVLKLTLTKRASVHRIRYLNEFFERFLPSAR